MKRTYISIMVIVIILSTLSLSGCSIFGKGSGNKVMKPMRDIPSIELIKEIKTGWNIGNTLDATGAKGLDAETSWGNPATTKEMIQIVKDAGFNTVRIPITWDGHFGEAPNYEIDKEWMDRIQEVTDYAIDMEMFAIINLHHEEWHFPSEENFDTAKEILIKIWEQIAERFEGYDEHLIFEAMNEPRLKGTADEWNGGNPEARDVVNRLNDVFYETIRNSGGNNPKRHLMLPTYAASSEWVAINDITLPEDDKIIVSVHAYTPYRFALSDEKVLEWDAENVADTRDIDNLMSLLDEHFISKDIPVIIGEYGARNKYNLNARVAWARYYIKQATEKGIPCIWWDNGAFVGSGENFGLLNRNTLTWEYPEIIDAIMEELK
ncbi:MAG: glycoside hydrolase family 5 protein [Clostridiales bacterium]|nr:glycoside hydrolase family 5 protein [Clostridiales bacterium]